MLRKNDTIYAPEQYRSIINKASRKKIVIDMTDHFRKINDLQQNFNLINRRKNTNNGKISFTSRDGVKWIRIDEYGSYLSNIFNTLTAEPFFIDFQPVRMRSFRGKVELLCSAYETFPASQKFVSKIP